MRYYQFKLTEEEVKNLKPVASGTKITDAEVEDDLDNIADVAANAKEQDPSYYKKIQNSLLLQSCGSVVEYITSDRLEPELPFYQKRYIGSFLESLPQVLWWFK